MLKKTLILLFLSSSVFALENELPTPLKFIENQGGKIVDSFKVPADMTGYVVDFRGNALTVYLSPNEQYLFTGKMIDGKGRDIGEEALQAYITGPKSEAQWQSLSESNWVLDGNKKAKKVVYTFTDPNCPYCKKFWEKSRPWVESGKVQIRHILVGILKADSYAKAAAILSTENPSDVLHKHQASASSALQPLSSPSKNVQEQLKKNHLLMRALGVSATPATYYKNEKNTVKLHMGLPSDRQIEQILGLKEEAH